MAKKIIKAEEFIEILQGKHYTPQSNFYEYYKIDKGTGNLEIIVKDAEISDEISDFGNLNVQYNVDLEDVTFKKYIGFSKVEFEKKLSIYNCFFEQAVHFYRCIIKELSFYKCTIRNHLTFAEGFYGDVVLHDFETESLEIWGGTYNYMLIELKKSCSFSAEGKSIFINKFDLRLSKESYEIEFMDAKLNDVSIYGEISTESEIIFSGLSLNNLKISSFINKGKVLLRNIISRNYSYTFNKEITVKKFFDDFSISAEVEKKLFEHIFNNDLEDSDHLQYLYLNQNSEVSNKVIEALFVKENLDNESTFVITRSELMATEFKNFDMRGFSEIKVFQSELSTVKTFNSPFPIKSIKGEHAELYEIFNDLYSVANKRNNKKEVIEYYKASQNALLNNSLEKENWSEKIPTIITLYLTKLYSNFGTNWVRSFFVWLPVFGFICFYFMMICSNYDFDLSIEGLKKFNELIPYYIQYLNPTHKVTFMDGVDDYIFSKNIPFLIFDIFGRSLVGIGIYETIQSFRKYGRK